MSNIIIMEEEGIGENKKFNKLLIKFADNFKTHYK